MSRDALSVQPWCQDVGRGRRPVPVDVAISTGGLPAVGSGFRLPTAAGKPSRLVGGGVVEQRQAAHIALDR